MSQVNNDFVMSAEQKAKLDEAGKRAYELGVKHRKNIIKVANFAGKMSGMITRVTNIHRELDKSGLIHEAIIQGRQEVLAPIEAQEALQKDLRNRAINGDLSSREFHNQQEINTALTDLGLKSEEANALTTEVLGG